MNNYRTNTVTTATKQLFNYSDFSYNNIKNYGAKSFYVELVTKFLNEYKEKRSYRLKKRKSQIEKESYIYTSNENKECVLKLVQEKNKIATINYQHLLNYIDDYYIKVVGIASKQGHEQSTSLIDLDLLNSEEKDDFDTYFGFKRLLKFLEGNKPYYFCEIFKEAIINVIRSRFTDLKLPTFSKIEMIRQEQENKDEEGEEDGFDVDSQEEKDLSAFENKSEFDDLHISIKNYDNEVDISTINASHISTLGTIKGQLTSYDDSNLMHTKSSVWICQGSKCRFPCVVKGAKPPNKCFNCGEKYGFVEEIALNETIDYIYIKLQQKDETDRAQIGFSSITVKIQGRHLINYFRENMKPTSVMSVTGVFEPAPTNIDGSSRSSNLDDRVAILNALNIEFDDANKSLEYNERYFEITKKLDLDHIEEHRAKMLKSTAPHIYGLDSIKQGVLLMCLGAEPVKRPDGSRVKGDSVVLIAGDSGMAKSDLGIWVCHVLTSSIRTVGGGSSGTTKVGLTAMTDTVNGVKRVTLGVLALCDRVGAAVIDELDKRTREDFETLAAPLDDNQRIEVHKGGHHISLPARCPVLLIGNASSATNKKGGGKWDPTKSINEQTNYAAWLMSRVDLTFIVYDNGDPEYHRAMLEHIKKFDMTSVQEHEYDNNQKSKVYSENMFEKLEQDIVSNNFDGIYDIEFMRHEIQYLKQNYKPKLIPNSDAYNLLETEWFKLKQMVIPEDIGDGKVVNNSVMDPRKINALKRLACSEARLRRHHVVTIEDAEAAVHVMLASVASMLPIKMAPGTEKLDSSTNPIDLMNQYLKDDKNKDKRRNAMVSEFIKFRDNILRAYKTKFKKFNHALMGVGFEKCDVCKGRGETIMMSPNGVDMNTVKCTNCKGMKMWQRSFTYLDLEHVVVNRHKIFSTSECKLYFNAYLESKIIDWQTNSTVRVQYDLNDSVDSDTLIEKLAMTRANEETNRKMQDEFGVTINLDNTPV